MITYDARILAEYMLENGRKWVLHPNFFSGNISKVILRISLKKMKPSRMDPGGGARKPPLDPGLFTLKGNKHKYISFCVLQNLL